MRSDRFASAAEITPSVTWGGLQARKISSPSVKQQALKQQALTKQAVTKKRPKRQKLLWVDDSSYLLSLYKAIFESLGFEILTTSSPAEAIHRVGSFADLVILDYEMPEMNGVELASLIKNRHPSIPVILYSGSDSIRSSAHHSVDAICAKGDPREELVSTIDQLLSLTARRKPCRSESLQSIRLPMTFSPSSDPAPQITPRPTTNG